MSQTLERIERPAESRGWRLQPGRPDPRALTLLHGGKVVHRLTYSSYATTTGELRAVGVTEDAARTLARQIAGKVVSSSPIDASSTVWDILTGSWD